MPGHAGHLVGGAVLGTAVLGGLAVSGLFVPDLRQGVVLGALVLLGALFPDVDTDSKGQRLFYVILAALDVALIVQGAYKWAAVLGLAAMFPAIGQHRGWTHTWWAMLVVPLPLLLLPMWRYGTPLDVIVPYYAATVVGYASHLLLDRTC